MKSRYFIRGRGGGNRKVIVYQKIAVAHCFESRTSREKKKEEKILSFSSESQANIINSKKRQSHRCAASKKAKRY